MEDFISSKLDPNIVDNIRLMWLKVILTLRRNANEVRASWCQDIFLSRWRAWWIWMWQWLRNLFTEPREMKNDARRRKNVTEITASTRIL